MRAAYDGIADWYEHEFLGTQNPRASDPLGIEHSLRTLLGKGAGGICLEIGCGTGIHAATVRELGWRAAGIDISAGMLRYARGRLAIARADAGRLPFRDQSLPAVISVMTHTDMPGYPAVLREAARALQPGGVLVHVGVHPCFCGGFANRSDPRAVVIRPGYRQTYWTMDSWTTNGVRAKVGAAHFPLSELLRALVDAGLTLQRFEEGGSPTPTVLAIGARKAE